MSQLATVGAEAAGDGQVKTGGCGRPACSRAEGGRRRRLQAVPAGQFHQVGFLPPGQLAWVELSTPKGVTPRVQGQRRLHGTLAGSHPNVDPVGSNKPRDISSGPGRIDRERQRAGQADAGGADIGAPGQHLHPRRQGLSQRIAVGRVDIPCRADGV